MKPIPTFKFALARPRFLAFLPSETDKKLTFLNAPSGFGKTIVMAQWAQEMHSKGWKILWHKISRKSGKLQPFYSHLRRIFSGDQGYIAQDQGDWGADELIEMSWGLDQKYAIFIDSLENLESPDDIRDMASLFEECGPNVQFILSSRKNDSVRLSALRSQNQLIHLDVDILKCDRTEAVAFLGRAHSNKQIAEVEALTDGWPVALWYIRQNPDLMSSQTESCDVNPYLASSAIDEFISENIMPSFDWAMINIITKMSLFEHFTAEQAAFICEMDDAVSTLSRQMLAPFIYRTKEENGEYRFNPIFREHLTKRLHRSEHYQLAAVHNRASRWYEKKGDILSAMEHAAKSAHPQRLVEIFNLAGGVEIGFRKGMDKLSEIVELIPPRLVEEEPQLALSKAILYMKDGNLTLGQHFMEKVHRQLSVDESDSSYEYYESIVKMLMATYEDRPISLTEIERLSSYNRISSLKSLWSEGWFKNLECMAHFSVGNMQEAEKAAVISLQCYQASKAIYSQIYMHLHLGLIYRITGDLSRSLQNLNDAQRLSTKYFALDKGLCSLADILLASIYCEYGDYHEAAQLIKKSLTELGRHEAWVEVLTHGYLTSSFLSFRAKFGKDAGDILGDCEAIAIERDLPRLGRTIDIQRIEIATLERNFEQAEYLIAKCNLANFTDTYKSQSNSEFQEYYRSINCIARYLIHTGRQDKALEMIEHAIQIQFEKQHISFLIKSKILKIIALNSTGLTAEADALFMDLIVIQNYRLFFSSFSSERHSLSAYLNDFTKRHTVKNLTPDEVSFISRLLSDDRQRHDSDDETNILSKREFNTLVLLSEGKSNKLIGRELDISEATVKFHLRNVFTKLGVSNRMMAVEVARTKNIIEHRGFDNIPNIDDRRIQATMDGSH
tara:strand:- start:1242 stop:3935 length:2694 start_codon:yes stop_codon:yes gene_type:complete